MTSALIRIEAKSWDQPEPAFDSFIVPVRGDLPPTETRADVEALVPVTIPGAKTSLLLVF